MQASPDVPGLSSGSIGSLARLGLPRFTNSVLLIDTNQDPITDALTLLCQFFCANTRSDQFSKLNPVSPVA